MKVLFESLTYLIINQVILSASGGMLPLFLNNFLKPNPS